MITPYFTDIRALLLSQLQYAQRSVYVAVAWFTDHALFALLCRLQEQHGIRVSLIIMQHDINRASGIAYEQLIRLGGRFYCIDAQQESRYRLMHHKFCVIDEQHLIIGSYNWTNQAANNMESVLHLQNDPQTAQEFIRQFEFLVQTYCSPSEAAEAAVPIGSVPPVLVSYVDYDVPWLQWQLNALLVVVANLKEAKAALEQLLYRFNQAYRQQLGDIMEQILLYQLKISAYEQALHPNSAQHAEQHRIHQQQYEQFRAAPPPDDSVSVLSAEEQEVLNRLFRKAAMLCHPDRYHTEAEKAQAHEYFVQINAARQQNNLKELQDLVSALEAGLPPTSGALPNDSRLLSARLERLLQEKQQLEHDIQSLQQSETHSIARQEAGAWQRYFNHQKILFNQQLQKLIQQWAIFQSNQ
jgi:hypothetical protein